MNTASAPPLTRRPWPTVLSAIAVISALATLGAPAASAAHEADLRTGAVFAMSNARDGNVVVAYDRAPDGTLAEVSRTATGGTGSGSFEDTANGLVLVNADGAEVAPNNLADPGDGPQLLLATNAGSDSVSVFTVRADGLDLVDVQDSNGDKPVSVTVNDDLVYVLNSGELNDDLFDADGNVIDNCTTGRLPTVTGFTLADDGQLRPIPGSTRKLSGDRASGCAQVSFTPAGDVLVVTERTAQPDRLGQQRSTDERIDDEGVIDTFAVTPSGRLGRPRVQDATGQGPFGFTFTASGALLTTEQFDGPNGPGLGAATSYTLDGRGDLTATAPSLSNGGTDTCWIVATDDGSLAFATSFFGDGRISSYAVDADGLTTLVEAVATVAGDDSRADGVATGASDLSLSRDSAHLYQLNSINGTINAFANDGDGTLTPIQTVTPFPQPAFGPGGGMAAPIGLSAS